MVYEQFYRPYVMLTCSSKSWSLGLTGESEIWMPVQIVELSAAKSKVPQLASDGKQQLTLIYFCSTSMHHRHLYKAAESICILTNFKAGCCNDCVIHHITTTVPYEELPKPLFDLSNTPKFRGLLSLGQKVHYEIRCPCIQASSFWVWNTTGIKQGITRNKA